MANVYGILKNVTGTRVLGTYDLINIHRPLKAPYSLSLHSSFSFADEEIDV